jgi:uncharacterized protein
MNQEQDPPILENTRERLQEKILEDYPRLELDDAFQFACHPGVSCFNHCCSDVNIFLSPYDVLRMKNRLGLKSSDFHDKYTIVPVQKDMKTPVVVLSMRDDGAKTCPFVTEKGCEIYSDRPWPCRMYPLGLASPDTASQDEEFFFLLKEDVCGGFDTDKKWTVREWLEDQEVEEYDEFGKQFKEITLHPRIQQGKPLEPKQLDMYFTACYDLDKFRRFLLDTSFFEKFEVDPETIAKLKTDDAELLRFGFRWIRFSILNEKTLAIKDEVIKAKQQELS